MYLENVLIIWEMHKLCGKWLRSVGNDSNMCWNDLIIWETAWKFGKCLKDLWNGQNIWEMAQIHRTQF